MEGQEKVIIDLSDRVKNLESDNENTEDKLIDSMVKSITDNFEIDQDELCELLRAIESNYNKEGNMKKKKLEDIWASIDILKDRLCNLENDLNETRNAYNSMIEPKEEYISLNDKKIIQEIERLRISNEKELRNLIPRIEVFNILGSIKSTITDRKVRLFKDLSKESTEVLNIISSRFDDILDETNRNMKKI